MKEPCSKCTRREWLGKLLTASSACALFSPEVSSAEGQITRFDQTLRLRVSDIPALGDVGGSVRATYNNWATPLMINRGEADTFYVVDPTCTHAGCEVDLYDHGQQMIICPCHWSTFDIAGRVTGAPAFFDLPAYACHYDAGVLTIEIPGLRFGIRSAVLVQTTLGATRMRLSFPTLSFATYRVRKAANLSGDFQLVNFATQIDGSLTQTSLSGNGAERQVFVDAAGSSAFYSLELVITYVS
jgi:Rieske Fe-S protein